MTADRRRPLPGRLARRVGLSSRPATSLREALHGVGLPAAFLAGVAAAGVAVSKRQAYPHPPREAARPARLPVAAGADGRVNVAVVLGASGSVVADAFGPYEVFARSPAFSVYTVAAAPTAMVSGGLPVLADFVFEDVDTGLAPEPDVVVVPAVVDPAGATEAPLREWVARRTEVGAQILGVCAGTAVLAATGLLDGRRATSHWSKIDRLKRSHPHVFWQRGHRYIEDGKIMTTAGVTSGVFGALRLVEQIAGAAEARRVGGAVAYPGWRLDAPTGIRAQRPAPADLTYLLTAVFPWFRPTIGVGLLDGVGEIDIASVFEIYANSFAARTVPIAAGDTVTTRHGLRLGAHAVDSNSVLVNRLIVPGAQTLADAAPIVGLQSTEHGLTVELPHAGQSDGGCGFDPVLRSLAAHADRASARTTAKLIEYPTDGLRLTGRAWPWRPTALCVLAVAAAIGLGRIRKVPHAVTR